MKTEITLDEIRADIVAAYPRIVSKSGMLVRSKIETEAPDLMKKIQERYGNKRQPFHTMINHMRQSGMIPQIGAKVNGSSRVLAKRKLAVGKVENPRDERNKRRERMMRDAHADAGKGQKIQWTVLKRVNLPLYEEILSEYNGNKGYVRAAAGKFRKFGLFRKNGSPHTNGHAHVNGDVNGDVKTVNVPRSGYAINRCPNCGMDMEGLSKAMLILSKLGPEKINAVLAGLQNLEG